MKRRLKNIWKPGTIVVVHLEIQQDELFFYASKVKQKKEGSVVPAQDAFDSLKSILDKYGKYAAYHLHVEGSGVLTRLVEFIPGYKDQLIVNADKNDFIFSSCNDGSHVAVSFFRKNLIAAQLEYLETEKVFLLGISSGIIPSVFAKINDNLREKVVFDYTFEVHNQKIESLYRTERFAELPGKRKLLEEKRSSVNEGILIPEQEGIEEPSFQYERNAKQYNEFTQYLKFRFFSILMVSVVLSALVANYFYVNYLNRETAQLEVELMLNNDNLALLDRLKQEKQRKEQLILTSGINSAEFVAFYMDKIGASVPGSIVLKEMYVFPLKDKIKEKKKLEIEQKQIEITGYTSGSESLDSWIEKINRFEWVKSVELISYLKTDGQNAEFKLVITLE